MESRRSLPTPECAPVRELLATAIDAPLTGSDRERAATHLATCRACRMFETELALDASAMTRLHQFDAPDRVARRVRATPRARGGGNGPAIALAFLGVALFAIVSTNWFRAPVGPGASSTAASPPGTSVALPSTGAPPSPSSATATPVPTGTPTPAPTPTAAASFAQLTGRLTRVEAPSLDGDAAIWGIVPWRDGAVAVGRRCMPPPGGERQCVAAAWRTADITSGTWDEQAPPPPSPNADGTSTVGLASNDERLVAVGHARLGSEFIPLIWTSSDGSTWTRVDAPAGVLHGYVTSVAAAPDGFVAVGIEIKQDVGLATAWHSADGVTWTLETGRGLDGGVRATTPLAPDTRRLEFGGMQDVAMFPDGRGVGVGARCRPAGDRCVPRAWRRSQDGSWTSVTVSEDLGELTAVTTVGARALAVGGDRAGDPIAFVSDDLITWVRLAVTRDGSRPGGFTDVVGRGEVAIGFTSDGSDLAIWRWTPAGGWVSIGDEGPLERTVFGTGMVGGQLLVGGRRAEGAALWTADEVAP